MGPGSLSKEESRAVWLAWKRVAAEETAKQARGRLEQEQVKRAELVVQLHEVRSPVAGFVQKIARQD
jgi:hypothetical protein